MTCRPNKTTSGASAMGALALWWADGAESGDYGKPIIAAANSITEFVPGHVLLAEFGLLICEQIWDQTAVPRKLNMIVIDDGRAKIKYSGNLRIRWAFGSRANPDE